MLFPFQPEGAARGRAGKPLFRLTGRRLVLFLLILNLTGTLALAASTAVTNVAVNKENGSLMIRIDVTRKVEPKITVVDPTGECQRLVVDIPGGEKGPDVPWRQEENMAPIQRIRLGEHPDKLRIVVDMDLGWDFRIKPYLFNNALVLEIVTGEGPQAKGGPEVGNSKSEETSE